LKQKKGGSETLLYRLQKEKPSGASKKKKRGEKREGAQREPLFVQVMKGGGGKKRVDYHPSLTGGTYWQDKTILRRGGTKPPKTHL